MSPMKTLTGAVAAPEAFPAGSVYGDRAVSASGPGGGLAGWPTVDMPRDEAPPRAPRATVDAEADHAGSVSGQASGSVGRPTVDAQADHALILMDVSWPGVVVLVHSTHHLH
jgi:hypothetical protein